MFFKSKQKEIEDLIGKYCQEVRELLDLFQTTMRDYLRGQDLEELRAKSTDIHTLESQADDVRREVEMMMYEKALFPESRGDVMALLEGVDRVPNQAEGAVRTILTQHIGVPETFADRVMTLVETSAKAGYTMLNAVGGMFEHAAATRNLLGKIDELESEVDGMQNSLIEDIFDADIGGFDKMQLREMVDRLARPSDRAENVADHIAVILAKRDI
jgi:predicted phosphate transport protein (TIGR00153 family)